jgi:hypothetical protein
MILLNENKLQMNMNKNLHKLEIQQHKNHMSSYLFEMLKLMYIFYLFKKFKKIKK